MRRILNRLYYFIETLFVRSTLYQLLLVMLGIFGISLAGGMLVFLFSPIHDDLWASVWWAFLRLSDPGYLGDDVETVSRVVSTILTVTGYVVFLGALVAIMTSWLNRFMTQLAAGRSRIFERDHILIIGWNPQLHAIIEEIVHAKERVVRRLGRSRLPAVAILTRDFRPAMLTELRSQLAEDVRDEVRLLVRSGNPLELQSLERVDFTWASSIILVPSSVDPQHRHLADITLIKILMTLRTNMRHLDPEELPNVVLDITNPANKLLAESVGWPDRTEAIATDEFVPRLICQSVRHPGMSQVYGHMLTDTFGESIFLETAGALSLAGKTLREALRDFETSIPLGYLQAPQPGRAREKRLRLLDLDTPMAAEDELVVISPSIRSISSGYEPGQTAAREARMARGLVERTSEVEGDDQEGGATAPEARRVLIVGWSQRVLPLLAELATYTAEAFDVTIVSEQSPDYVRDRVSRLDLAHDNIEVFYEQADLYRTYDLQELRPERFDAIVLMSAEESGDPLLSDAETVMIYVVLQRHLQALGLEEEVIFVAELNDEDNRDLFDVGGRLDVIMTQEIISHLLSQVAVRRALAWIYEELFTSGGPEIRFRAFDEVMDASGTTLTFDACQRACLERGSVALGIFLRHGDANFAAGMHLNPARLRAFSPGPDDRLVVLEAEEGGVYRGTSGRPGPAFEAAL